MQESKQDYQPTILKKPNVTVVMMPRVGRLSPLSRKIFNVLLKSSQETILKMNAAGQPILATHRFQMPLRDLLTPLESSGSHLSTHVREYLPSANQKGPYEFNELTDAKVDWWAPDKDGDVVWTGLNLFSEIKYNATKKELLWALPPTIFEALEDVEEFDENGRPRLLFTLLDLEMMGKLKTYTAVALFEVASRYKNNTNGTSEQTVDWWMGALLQSAPTIDPKTKLPKIRSWAKFKDEQLNPAIEEINSKTDLYLALIDRKSGKKITHAKFEVRRKRVDAPINKDPYQLDDSTVLHLTKLGLRVGDVRALLQMGCSQDLIRSGLIQLESRLARTDQGPVVSRIAYLRSLVQKLQPYPIVQATAALEQVVSSSKNVQQLLPPLNVSQAQEKLPVVVDEATQHRLDLLAEIKLLSKEEQMDLVMKALIRMPSATPNMRRRATEGDWAGLRLMTNEMINLYAKERYLQN